MSEFNPLVERVDALLKRHHRQQQEATTIPAAPSAAPSGPAEVAPTAAQADDDIPVLTEIIEMQSASPGQAAEASTIAAGIEDAVLGKLMAELDRSLEMRLNRTIGDLLEQAIDGLHAELSASVREMVREAVATAVAKQIAERQRG